MPPIRKHYSGWTDLHRQQLRDGADANYQPFGESRVRCRRRYGAADFRADTMALAERAWSDLKDELLATVDDPWQLWGYRRFDLKVEPLNIDTGPIPTVPPKPVGV